MKEQKKIGDIKKTANGIFKANHTNNYIECEWSKHLNKKTKIIRLDIKTVSMYMQSIRHTHRFKDTNSLEVKDGNGYTIQTVIIRELNGYINIRENEL